ncbi:MAG: GTP-binding protein [Eggerthellaceae bacterium]|nr:GTP-binding protein [Eggerthellaceae bacterium]
MLAHVDAGKTTLIESLLFRTGAVRKLGSVDAGDSHLDFNELEQRRGITIYAKQAMVEFGGAELTLIDTPGHVDFSSEAERTLQVLDYAVLVVDANSGVRGHTETLWRLLEHRGIPTFVFANKMDLAVRTREDVMEELRGRLSDACLDFSDLGMTRLQDGAMEPCSPEELAEACAATDETALDEYFEKGKISASTLRRLVAERSVFPCFFGSALKLDGIDELLGAIAALVAEKAYPAEFGARVFKISHDPAGARLTWMKVTGGVLEVKQPVEFATIHGVITEKANQIRRYSGSKSEAVPTCVASQVCAVTGFSHTSVGMALGSEAEAVMATGDGDAPRPYKPALVPTLASSVIPNGCDVRAVHAALNQLTDEDPLLGAQWSERLQELQVQVMGAIQLEVLQATLKERFDLDVSFGPSGVLYRETIEEPVTGIGHFEPLRHYAEVHLRIEPLPPGSGVRFGTCCHVDELDLNWQRLILTNAMEREHLGVLIGAPITDVRITLIGGRAHDKHTEGGDFRQATYRAIRQGLMQAKSVLLEPWSRFSLRVPADRVGRAFSDLQLMGARYDTPKTEGDFTVIEGVAPAGEIGGYAVQLSSYTHGMGSLSLEFHGYEPCHNAQEIIDAAAYDPEADLANTPDSVFCSHGAGRTVKWDEVAKAAHVKPNPATFTAWREATPEFFGNLTP